jgi:hypothetical protein
MSLALAKDIFFFVGSTLGILAFFKSAIDPLLDANRQRWKQVAAKVDDNDLRALEVYVYQARRVPAELLDRIYALVRDIEEDAEYVRFGPILRRCYAQHLRAFVRQYYALRKLIQVPFWEPEREKHNGKETEEFAWEFQKDYFFSSDYSGISYECHLGSAADTVEALRVEYKALSILSDLHAVELPFTCLLLPRRLRQRIQST